VHAALFASFACSQQESNPHRQLRKLVFYPLNYGSALP
jgi:hypothetical protein